MLLATICAFTVLPAKPLMRDFVGLNTHTIQFKTDLYKPVTRHLRNYHPVSWDLGDDPASQLKLPMAQNGVDWNSLYPVWAKAGYQTSACLMFEEIPAAKWKDRADDAFAYGYTFGRVFGRNGAVSSVEIGNEPGLMDDAQYAALFKPVAEGIRRATPKLPIATCAVRVGPSGRYHKSIDCYKGLENLYDVINVHSYAETEPWPTFRRTHPEDPKTPFLPPVEQMIAWRDKEAPSKPVWVTEFGWDASTKTPDPKGDNAKWVGNTDLQQAQWLVRGFMELARVGVDRAFVYWFNDEDKPSMHASSGLTRNYVPKPSFWAVAQFLRVMGDYRFGRVVQRVADKSQVVEFKNDAGSRIWIAWVPSETGASATVEIPLDKESPIRAEGMATADGAAPSVEAKMAGKSLRLTLSGSPTYIFLKD